MKEYGFLKLESSLEAIHYRMNRRGLLVPYRYYGIISRRMVTTAGVNFLCDAFQGLATLSNMKYHASGTGTNIEAITDVALQTEVESRVAGTQSEGASANIYSTVATLPYTGTRAITEHGLFSASSSVTLWDRSVFSAINVINGDSIQFTYELTLTAGG